ncbi:HET-domain-containing protein [Thozetella sp. PMI_491]|nr:HET-domain-containing protein [Thozetella sp. PMI_491]
MDRSIDHEVFSVAQTEQARRSSPFIPASETPPLIPTSTALGPESSRDSFGIGWRSSPSDISDTASRISVQPATSWVPPSPPARDLKGLGIFRNYASKSTISVIETPIDEERGEPLHSVEEENSTDKAPPLALDKPKGIKGRLRFSKASTDVVKRHIQNAGEVVGHVKGSIRDLRKTAQVALKPNSGGLCEACSTIPFEKSLEEGMTTYYTDQAQEAVVTDITASLDRVLQHRTWCKFCRVLFAALSMEKNDPLRHPAVQNHIQDELKGKMFAEWADRASFLKRHTASKATWPFGHRSVLDEHSSDEPREAPVGTDESPLDANGDDLWIDDPELETITVYSEDTASIAGSVATTKTDVAKEKVTRAIESTTDTITAKVRKIKRPLPVWIIIKAHAANHPEAGTLQVRVQGQGRAPGATHCVLSSFNLRIASSKYDIDKTSGAIRYGRELNAERIDLDLCHQWLEHCEVHHGAVCSHPSWAKALEKPSGLGFRVVDVIEEKVVEFPKPAECDYVTLSYVWGGYTTVQLLKSNVSQLSRKGGLSEANAGLPQTVRSAMAVTKGLGKRYIWIDSLCIVQDGDDKIAQLSQMDRIYGNSAVAIVAADGINANSGLPGVSGPRSTSTESIQVVEEVIPGVKVLVPIQHKPNLEPWDTRAWTFQEKMLSKRLLIFSRGHAYFHCKHGVHMEDMTLKEAGVGPRQIDWLSLPENDNVSMKSFIDSDENGLHIHRSPVFDQYAGLITKYTSRQLSFSSDILHAVTGLLAILDGSRLQTSSRDPGTGTIYGIPLEFLDLALLWQPAAAKDVRLRKRVLVGQDQKPLEDKKQLPSWSWAAWEAIKEGERNYSGGVRYEVPFTLVSDSLDGFRVKKVLRPIADAEERVRPFLQWYRLGPSDPPLVDTKPPPPARSSSWSVSRFKSKQVPKEELEEPSLEVHGSLKPVNGTSLGLASDSADKLTAWVRAHKPQFSDRPLSILELPADIARGLDERHLIFRTSTAKFRLGNKTLRSETIFTDSATTMLVPDRQIWIHEIEILDSRSFAAGRVTLHDATETIHESEYHDFIVISEAQYFGDEEEILLDGEYPLYNVMMVKWDKTRPQVASRLAIGKVLKEAWAEGNPTEQIVVLE